MIIFMEIRHCKAPKIKVSVSIFDIISEYS